MKTTQSILIALAAAVVPLATTQAEINPAIIPSEARWVVSIDLNSVREAALGKEIIDLINAQIKMPMPDNQVEVRIDMQKLLATVGSITAYGTSFSKNPKDMDGALVLQGTADLRKIAEALVAQTSLTNPEEIVELKDLPFEAYTVHGEITVGFPPEPIILVSKSKAQLVKARDVFRTGAGSIAKSASPLSILLPKGGRNYIVAASVVPPTEGMFPMGGPQARILQMANAGSIAIGENEKNTTAQVQLVASDDQMGEKLLRILNGLTAVLSFAETNDKQLTEFLQSVAVVRTGKAVTLNLAYPTEGIVRMVHSLQAQHQPQQREVRIESRRKEDNGRQVAEWEADQQIGQPTPTAEGLSTRTIEDVALKSGSTITIAGRMQEGEKARLDCVDIIPAAGGAPLHFEAENMRLSRYQPEQLAFASGRRGVMLTNDYGTARFEFPGVDGAYTIKVRFIDESDGKSTFTVSVKDPETPAGPE